MHWFKNLNLSTKLLLPVGLTGITILVILIVTMNRTKNENVELAGLKTAEAVANQITTLRTFYTAEIVTRAKKAGMEVDHTFAVEENTLPLPATLVHVLGEQIARDHKGMNIRLYSRFPFPHRTPAQTRLDDFEEEAITFLEKNPTGSFNRLEPVDNRLSMRYAIADTMRPACVNCHNSHPDSPKRGWKVGDVRGVVEVTVPVDTVAAALDKGTLQLGLIVVLGMGVIIGLVAWILRVKIVNPIRLMADMNVKIARGDLSEEILYDSPDEVGTLARSFKEMKAYLYEVSTIATEIAGNNLALEVKPHSARDVLNNSIKQMVNNLRNLVGQLKESSDIVAATARQLADGSGQISSGAEAQSSAAEETSASMEELGSSMQMVAGNAEALAGNVDETSASIEEMAASIQLVSRNTAELAAAVDETLAHIEAMAASVEQVANNTGEVSKAAQAAVADSQEVGDISKKAEKGYHRISATMGDIVQVIEKLDRSNQQINSIVDVIDDIADQTNLLALNAAIEAARAGEHGRGFAVVADEVRKLAERSAGSAKEIVALIKDVQKDSRNAIQVTKAGAESAGEGLRLANQAGVAVEKIVRVIGTINRMISEISKATEQQAKASGQIVKTMENMRRMTQEVNKATREQATGSDQIIKAVDVMMTMTRQVALSTNEQKKGGEQIIKAAENVSKIAGENLRTTRQLIQITERLNEQAANLNRLTATFKVENSGK